MCDDGDGTARNQTNIGSPMIFVSRSVITVYDNRCLYTSVTFRWKVALLCGLLPRPTWQIGKFWPTAFIVSVFVSWSLWASFSSNNDENKSSSCVYPSDFDVWPEEEIIVFVWAWTWRESSMIASWCLCFMKWFLRKNRNTA